MKRTRLALVVALALAGCYNNQAAADWYLVYQKSGVTDRELMMDGVRCNGVAAQEVSATSKGFATAGAILLAPAASIVGGVIAQADGGADRAAEAHHRCMETQGYTYTPKTYVPKDTTPK